MENKAIVIQKLNGNNYYMWKFKIELLLQRDKLWATLNQDPPATLLEEWTVRDQAAKATICLSMEDNLLINIRHCTTAKETWKTLMKLYEQPSLSTKLHLLRKLYSTRYEHYENMTDFINAILEITGQLKSLGESINDKNIIAIMLCGLPNYYNNLITAIESKEEDSLTLDYVKRKLFEESLRRDKSDSIEMEPMAMQTLRNNMRSKNYIICYECGKHGHTRRECPREPTRNPGGRGQIGSPESYRNTNSRFKNTGNQVTNMVMSSSETRSPQDNQHYSCEGETCTDQIDSNYPECHRDQAEYTALSGVTHSETENWILDSGASNHMTPNKNFFQNITYLKNKIPITLADGNTVYAEGKGDGMVVLNNDISAVDKVKICDVMYVPSLKFQLLSIKQLCKRGHRVNFKSDICNVINNDKIIASAGLKGGTFILNENRHTVPHTLNSCIHEWHNRMGHRSTDNITKMSRETMAIGLKINKCSHNDFCKTCQLSKMKQKTFKANPTSTIKPFELIVTDVCGPMSEKSLGGNLYVLTMTDSHSKYLHTEMLRQKSQVTEKLINFLENGHNRFGYYPTTLRSDGGGEFKSNILENYLSAHGISHQTIVPYAPQQNGQAERVNSTLMNMTRCMLKHSGLPKKLWGEAISTATYIINRTCHSTTQRTPYEAWTGERPNFKEIKTFGCQAFAFIPKALRKKLDDTSTEGIFVGYGLKTKGFRLWIPNTTKVITTTKMTFNEDNLYQTGLKSEPDRDQCDDDSMILLPPTSNELPLPCNENVPRRSARENKGIPPIKLTY